MRTLSSRRDGHVLRRATIWLCAMSLLTCPVAMATEWDAYTAITDVSITNPTASEVWRAGSDWPAP